MHDRLSPQARKGHGARRPTDSRACANPACGTVFESANTKRQYCSDTCRARAFYARRRQDEEIDGARRTMALPRLYEWCLHPRHDGVCGEAAIRAAIAKGSATVSTGPHRFEYRDEALPDGRHLLTLSPLSTDHEPEQEDLDGYSLEKRVPAPLGHWGDEEKQRLVLVLGHALFEDVEGMVSRGVRFR
jgi:hypothetical protein